MARGRKASSETSKEVKVENVEIKQPTDTNEELSTEPQNAEAQEVIDENNAEAVNDKAEGPEEEVSEHQEETKELQTSQSEKSVEEPKVGELETPKAAEPETSNKNIKAVIAQEILKRKNGALKSKRPKSFEEAVRLRLKQGHKITFNEVKASRLAGKPSELSQEREFRTRSLRRN